VKDISDVNFDARHNKYCEISWQEISGHGREETTRILVRVISLVFSFDQISEVS